MVTILKTHKAVATPAPRAPLVLVDRETELPGPGEVLIHNEWTASSPLDLHRADGGLLCNHPEVMGSGAAGTVVAVGAGPVGDRLRPGDQVFIFGFRFFRERAHQDFATVPDYLVAKLPSNVAPQAAVTVPTNLITVFHAATADLGLRLPWPKPEGWVPEQRDDAVLVWGAASSVGEYALQVLRHWGYRNVLAVASAKHHARLRGMGAREAFDYRDADVADKILEFVGDGAGGVPFVLDCIGSVEGTLRPLTGIARAGTRVAVMLPVIVRDATDEVAPEYEMDVGKVLVGEWAEGVELRGVRTHGYLANEFFKEKMQREIVPKLLEDGIIKPNKQKIVEGATMLERAQKAIELLRKRDPSGERLVWRVSDLKL